MKLNSNFILWLAAIILAVTPVIVYIITLNVSGFAESSRDFGIFGDYIGGTVGTIVGIISIYLLYKTYTSQVLFARNQAIVEKRQQFESTFFNLLERQQSLREQLECKIGEEHFQSFSYLKRMREELSDALACLNYREEEVTVENKILLKNIVNQLYLDFFIPNVSHLGHYFRHLYHIIKYVDESNLQDAKQYVDILQAQLSNDELYLLAINGISNYGRRKMLPLMDKYSLLENFNANDDMLIVKLLSIFYTNTENKYLMSKSKRIIFIGGVHGVGKSTFVNAVKVKSPSVEGLSFSTILKWENTVQKTVENVAENQNKLLTNLPYFIDMDKNYLLDGHFCLLTSQGDIKRVPIEVFDAINPDMIVLLEESPAVICQRLSKRDTVEYPEDLIKTFLFEERMYAKEVADTLGVPIKCCNSETCNICIDELIQYFYSNNR